MHLVSQLNIGNNELTMKRRKNKSWVEQYYFLSLTGIAYSLS